MRIFLIAIFSLVVQLNCFEMYIPPIPISVGKSQAELSVVVDSEDNMVAVWIENGTLFTSDLSSNGAWKVPVPLSNVLKKSSSPRIAKDSAGNTTILWIEENSIRTATRPPNGTWSISTMAPSLLECCSSEEKSDSRLSVSLTPIQESEIETSKCSTIQVTSSPSKENLPTETLPLSLEDPALIPMANVIDAPTSSVLSGGQIGFAAGTAAPANGLIVSSQVGIGTSSPNSSSKLHVYSGNTVLQTPTLYGPAQFVYDTLDVWPTLYTNSTNGGISVNTIDAGGYAPVTSRFALKSNSGGSYRGAIDIITRNSSNVVLTNVEAISILESGNVGINESNPLTPLQISTSASGSTTYDIVTLFNSAAVDAAGFRIRSTPYTGNTQSYIDFVGNSLSNFQSYLTFGVNNGSGAFEAMRINPSGNVGIGQTNPDRKLYVLRPTVTSSLTGTGFVVTDAVNTTMDLLQSTTESMWRSNVALSLAAGNSFTGHLYINTSGNVGIGKTSPSVPLDVLGTTQIGGATGTNPATLILNPAGAGFVSQIQSLSASPQTLNITHNGNLGIVMDSSGKVGIGRAPSGSGFTLEVYRNDGNFNYVNIENGQNAQSAVRLKTPSAEWINYIPASSTELRFYNSSDLLTITAAGHLLPGIVKLQNFGSTTNRWGTIYYVTAVTGTSRLADSRTLCMGCNQPMKRGTGTTYTLGEDADYIPVFCTNCGYQKVEKIEHLPKSRLLERRSPPKIEFLGFKVNQYSGHSRGIQVLYRYIDKTEEHSAVENSTCLSDSEYEQFLLLSESEQRAYLKELGQREWDAIEEVRLMKEECASLQTQLDAIVGKWVGTDLSLSP